MIELILLVGLAALFTVQRNLKRQLDRVERQLAILQHPPAPVEPLPSLAEPEPAPRRPWTPPPVHEAPEYVPEPEPPVRETFATLFERFVAGRLLIWIGGISLAVAGVFLVRYSIEIGLVTPPVRMMIAAGFGALLILAGEAARSRPAFAGDPRIAQALAGAGILVLYATAYGSLTLYGLIGLGTASLLMALITATALALSFRHGAPTAVMGLTGGFLTPLLVGDPDSSAVPLLAYLALLNAALFAIAQRRGWTWLAAAAVLLSFVWTGLILVDPDADDALAAGVFIVAMGVAASLARPGEGRQLRLLQPAAIGLVQLALLVGREDLGVAAWVLFGALSVAGLYLSTRSAEFRLLPALALMLALILLAAETAMRTEPLAPAIAAAITLLFGGFAFPQALRRERTMWTAIACAAIAGPVVILRITDPGLAAERGWATVMIGLALATAALAWMQRSLASGDRLSVPLLVAGAATALLLALALNDLLPTRFLPAAWLLLALAGGETGRRLGDKGLGIVALGIAAVAVIGAVLLVPQLWETVLESIGGLPALVTGLPTPGRAAIVLLVPGALLLALGRRPELEPEHRLPLAVAATVLILGGLYVLAKQLFALESGADFGARGFAERAMITQALFLAGFALCWSGRTGLAATGLALTLLAAARLLWFDLLVHNPVLVDQRVGSLPVLNLLLPAYLGGAAWLYAARRRGGRLSDLWLGLFLAALIAGTMLLVRQAFQGALLSGPEMPRGEFYGYSLAGLSLSVGLLVAGMRLPDKALRVAGLALLTATIVKVFLVDAAALEGLLRILSFLGLGIALIGVGKLYARVLNAESRPERSPAEAGAQSGG